MKVRWVLGGAVLTAIAMLAVTTPAARADEPIVGVEHEHFLLDTRTGRVETRIAFPTVEGGARAAGPLPVILEYTPYCPRAGHDLTGFVMEGYVFVTAHWLGTCASDGNRFFSEANRIAGYDLVEWLGTQPWSNGKVGMIGISAPGFSQAYIAQMQPPHLATIAPSAATPDPYGDVVFRGGMRSTTEMGQLGAIILGQWYGTHVTGRAADVSTFPADVVDGTVLPSEWGTALVTRPNRDEFWDEITVDLSAVEVPVLSLGNWDDFSARGAAMLYELPPSRHNAFMIGNTGHSHPGPGRDFYADHLRWYDHWLKGIKNGVEHPRRADRVEYFVRGANEWRQAMDFPIPGTEYTDLYVGGGDPGLAGATGLLSTDPPAEAGADTYAHQPTQGRHNGQVGYAPLYRHNTDDTENNTLIWNDPTNSGDQRLEAPGSLTYVTEPLAEDTEVTGHVIATLVASTTTADTDFVVKLVDVHPDRAEVVDPGVEPVYDQGPQPGFWDLVTTGWLKGTHRNGDYVDEPIPTGTAVEYTIETRPTSHLFKAGHRIALQISSADAARTLPNPLPAVVDVLRGPNALTSIRLPIVPRG